MKTEKILIDKIIQTENCRNREIEIDSLMDSIKNNGLLQPIGIVKRGTLYEILFGNRRFSAVRKLGFNEIDAIVFKSKSEQDFKIINLIENLQRKDATIQDQGRVIHELRDMSMTDSEIAARLSIPTSRVKALANAFSIPEEYKKYIKSSVSQGGLAKKGKVPLTTADAIIKMKKEFGLKREYTETLFKYAKEEGFGNENLRIVASLIKQGYTVEQAIKKQKETIMVRVNLAVNKAQIEKLMEKHNLVSKTNVITAICRGAIPERLKLFYT